MQPARIVVLKTSLEFAWSPRQQRLLDVLQGEGNRDLTPTEICRKAGYASNRTWYSAMKDPQFAAAVEALGIQIRRYAHPGPSHLDVTLVANPDEELRKDVWDVRRVKANYPKHVEPSQYKVNFTWIVNHELREQVKRYFRLRLSRWEARTVKNVLATLRPFLAKLPPEVHVGTLTRSHVEVILPTITQLHSSTASRCLRSVKAMLEYMATSPAWTGFRPFRGLIFSDDIPSLPETLPRPIPPDVLDQLDPLLEEAVAAMKAGQVPSLLAPMYWDAILVLRHTGMRSEDLAHLKAPDDHGRNGCLDQDSDGYWWIRLHYSVSKMNKDHRIPTRTGDGVIDAIRRQQARIRDVPDHFGEHYLFRTKRGVLAFHSLQDNLEKLAAHLKHEEQPYVISPHQFRHTIATDMIEQGVDIYTVKEFLGHKTLAMTERYVKVYLTGLKAKYDAYRVKKQQTYASEMMANQIRVIQPEADADGGWVEGKVGKLYLSPLPDGIGNCAHLPMHDGCPDSPHCPTCPKLRATKRHLPMWEYKARNLRLTIEALRENPAYARARQKHEQELRHAEKVIETIKREGFWDGRLHNR